MEPPEPEPEPLPAVLNAEGSAAAVQASTATLASDLASDVTGATPAELAAVTSMQTTNGDDAYYPPEMILRFLRAENLDPVKASASLEAHVVWREKWQPDSIKSSDVEGPAATITFSNRRVDRNVG